MDNDYSTPLSLGAALRRVRRARGYALTVASRIREKYGVKIDPSYLSRMERDRVEVPLRTLRAICDFLNVSPSAVLSMTEESRSPSAAARFTERLEELLDELFQGRLNFTEKDRENIDRCVVDLLTYREGEEKKTLPSPITDSLN